MVLVGRLTGQRLNTWLAAQATSTESYAARTIYNIPSDGRTVRVCQIGYDTVAISNTPTAEQIHSIIDRHRAGGLPFSGSSLLDQHYHEVPLLAIAWPGAIGLLSGLLLLLIALPIAGLLFSASPRQLLAGLGDPLVVPALRSRNRYTAFSMFREVRSFSGQRHQLDARIAGVRTFYISVPSLLHNLESKTASLCRVVSHDLPEATA